jgi:ADP-heptose:LPS heptosyltransferase
MRNGKQHPKNYPYWSELIAKLRSSGHEIIQTGSKGEEAIVEDVRLGLSLTELTELVKSVDTWISIDSFGQHFCWDLGKPGIVIFGQSDPVIFGHPENINLLKDRKYLREKQFWLWEQCEANDEVWVTADEVLQAFNAKYMM